MLPAMPATIEPWVLLTLVALGLHMFAEYRSSATWGPIAIAVTKLAASSGFLLVAVSAGALELGWGRWLFAGLALSFIGDACLLGRGKPMFLAGLVAFLLGHVSYCVAFVVHGFSGTAALVLAPVMLLAAWLVDRWLGDRVEPGMRLPVRAYIVVISTMLCLAFGAWRAGASSLLLLGALSFYLSDLSVARDRFIQQDFFNRLWGLPAYYLGQLCLAMSVVAQ
jgi:uncharacterized membrane protein YhhN